MSRARKAAASALAVFTIFVLLAGSVLADGGGSNWLSAGDNLENTRFQAGESKIGTANVGNLAPKWQFTTAGDVSATAAVDGSAVYFPDWGGKFWALDKKTGNALWHASVPDLTGFSGDISRSTPVIFGKQLIFGNQGGYHGGAGVVMSLNKNTGALLWKTEVESAAFFPIVTQSAIVDSDVNGRPVVFVGVASAEEAIAAAPGYPCCSFRGSLLALDANTGAIIWKTYTVPAGYSGGAVWGSTPAVDRSRKTVYVATGNNYSMPADVMACIAAAGSDPVAIRACISPDNHFDSILALDEATGAIKWATSAIPFDAWNVDCLPAFGDGSACPQPAGPDYDFGQGPMLFSTNVGAQRDLVGAGQKSGQFWTLDRDTGAVVWTTQVGPGGIGGGLQWGSATDGTRIYVSNHNSDFVPWINGSTSGGFAALDPATGQILWETADPHGQQDAGPVSVANGVVYGCSIDAAANGYMYALDAATGQVKWTYGTDGSCYSGASISNGAVFWGSGYANFGQGLPGKTFYAFSVP